MIEGPYTFDPRLMKIYGTLNGKKIEVLTISGFYALTGKTFKTDFGMPREKALKLMRAQGERICEMLEAEDMI